MKQHWVIYRETRKENNLFFSDVHFLKYLKTAKNICICLPEEQTGLRIAKYVLRPILQNPASSRRLVLFLEKSLATNFDEFTKANKLFYSNKENSNDSRPSKNMMEKIRLSKFDVFMDWNTEFHLGNAILGAKSRAFVRIGFENSHSDKFFNIELSKTENGFLEETYSAVRRMLCL